MNNTTNLFVLGETFTTGSSYSIINIISALSIMCGIFVIISKNPIVSVLFLIGLFLNIAVYLMIIGINFIGLSYLLVYVGAVSILFLFILMLINVRISELSSDNSNSLPLGLLIGIIFNIVIYSLLPNNTPFTFFTNNKYLNNNSDVNMQNLNLVTSYTWDGSLSETSHITTIGNIMYTGYPLLLILTSLILLLAMVGAIIITIKK